MLSGVKENDRLGVCFDTCHAFAAGHPISTREGVEEVLADFDKRIGLSRIKMFHVNDSRSPINSHRDRHEHLGKGYIQEAGFKALLSRPEFSECTFILETPKDDPRADVRNLEVLHHYLNP